MNLIRKGLTGTFILIIILLGISSFLTQKYLQILPVLLMLLMFSPAVGDFLNQKIEMYSSRTRILIFIFLLVTYFSAGKLYMRTNIYRSKEDQKKIAALYDSLQKEWPADTEDKIINNSYGQVHVLITGPDTASPLILLHAENMSAVSWNENISSLNKHYRCYAIDHIGEAGKSVLSDLNNFPRTEQELVSLYLEIADSLGINKASLVGAGSGGRIALLLASYAPTRVNKLVLIGPLGINKPAPDFIWRTISSSMFPLPSIRQSTKEWIMGTSETVAARYGEWYDQILSGTVPHSAYPMAISSAQLVKVESPVLLILGSDDKLTGNSEIVLTRAKNINNLQSSVLPSSHLMAIEKSAEVNELLTTFLD